MSDLIEAIIQDELESAAAYVEVDGPWQRAVVGRVTERCAISRKRRHLAAAAAALVVGAVVGLTVGRSPGRAAPAPVDHDRQHAVEHVDIGGRSLAMTCAGSSAEGEPTVVLDVDLGADPSSYRQVVARLADHVQACTYDRAGTGGSDAADAFPRTAQDLADDLRLLVDRAGLGTSIVLVSDGFSALSAAVLAVEDPDLVDGLVLLDPQGPHYAAAQLALLGPPHVGESALVTGQRTWFDSGARSANGEGVNVTESEAQVRGLVDGPAPAFGDTPVAVLWSGDRLTTFPHLPSDVRSGWWSAWLEDVNGFATESSRGSVRGVSGSVGALADAAPDEVVRAVDALLGRVDLGGQSGR